MGYSISNRSLTSSTVMYLEITLHAWYNKLCIRQSPCISSYDDSYSTICVINCKQEEFVMPDFQQFQITIGRVFIILWKLVKLYFYSKGTKHPVLLSLLFTFESKRMDHASSPLWDSNHDWILQFDSILKSRPNQNHYTHSSNLKDRNQHQLKEYQYILGGKYKIEPSFPHLGE